MKADGIKTLSLLTVYLSVFAYVEQVDAMEHVRNAAGFFCGRGLVYGSLCGVISGSLIVPVFGSFYSLLWGTGTGLFLGLVIGITTGCLDLVAASAQWRLRPYRRRMGAITGIFTAVAAPVIVYLTGEGTLWHRAPVDPLSGWDFSIYLLPVLLLTAFWGGLAAAYTAQVFNDQHTRFLSMFPDHEFFPETKGHVTFWGDYLFKWHWFHLMLGLYSIAPMIVSLVRAQHGLFPEVPLLIIGCVLLLFFVITIASCLVVPLLGCVTGLMIVFINRIIFEEYFSSLPLPVYKNILTVLVLAFGLTAGIVVTGLIFTLPAAIALGITARAYADWYWTTDRKQKNKHQKKMDELHINDNPFEVASSNSLSDDRSEGVG